MSHSNDSIPTKFGIAASDITAGYAANSFLSSGGIQDPWAEPAFITFFDAIVNHEKVLFSHPTAVSATAQRASRLPVLFQEFLRNEADAKALLTPHTEVVADDYNPSPAELDSAFGEFKALARANRDSLDRWITFQESLRSQHLQGVPNEVQPHTFEFWSSLTRDRLPDDLGIAQLRLRYAFDVFFRGRLYLELLGDTGARYCPHTVRVPLMRIYRREQSELKVPWSWGGIVASLIKKGRLSSKPDELRELANIIQRRVPREGATCYDKKPILEMQGHAASLGLPAKMQGDLIDATSKYVKQVAVGVDLYLGTTSIFGVVLLTELLNIHIKSTERYVPGKIGTVKVFRSHLEWPGWNCYDRAA